MKKIILLALIALATTLSVEASSLDTCGVVRRDFRSKIDHVDRSLNKNVFIHKGEWITGLTASYYTFSAEDSDFMLFVDNVNADFGMTSIKPYVGYFYRDNSAVGMRFGYSYIGLSVDSARIDLGEDSDIQIDIPYVHYSGNYYTASIFHRTYAALDRKGQFGLFAEVELSTTNGSSVFEYESGGSNIYTRSDKTSVELSFNPGMSVFIMNNVSGSLSFEFGGVDYTSIKQYDENGVLTGSRKDSGMSFKFNFLAINLGFTVHIW